MYVVVPASHDDNNDDVTYHPHHATRSHPPTAPPNYQRESGQTPSCRCLSKSTYLTFHATEGRDVGHGKCFAVEGQGMNRNGTEAEDGVILNVVVGVAIVTSDKEE